MNTYVINWVYALLQ